jgi:hypothetical protein
LCERSAQARGYGIFHCTGGRAAKHIVGGNVALLPGGGRRSRDCPRWRSGAARAAGGARRRGPSAIAKRREREAMTAAPSRSAAISIYLLILASVLTFAFDFAHGIALGQDGTGFHPIYRLRQALAIAISRMHEPPLDGYLAYQSVVDSFNRNGFAVLDDDKGPHLGVAEWNALLSDRNRMNQALREAGDTPVDAKLPSQLVLGNELGYADYWYLAFRLFGLNMSSQYYLYFLLLGISCGLFVIEFKRSPFVVFLLLVYLAGLVFLQNYARSMGIELATLANSRLFEALSLLPATHLFLIVWTRMRFRWSTAIGAAIQSALLAFIVDCRITARWQVAMIVGAALVILVAGIWKQRPLCLFFRKEGWDGVWAACLAVAVVAAHMTFIHYEADARYGSEPRYHVVWHEVLRGLLGGSLALQREYLGREIGITAPQDTDAYDAIFNDLTKRNDRSAAGSFVQNGRIYIDIAQGWNEYERLARNLSIRIALDHPGQIFIGFYYKLIDQARAFTVRGAMVPANLATASLIAAFGGLLWLSAGGLATPSRAVLDGAGATIVILAFAAIPPLIVSSVLSVGTLLSYLIALVAASAVSAMVISRTARNILARARKRSAKNALPDADERRS